MNTDVLRIIKQKPKVETKRHSSDEWCSEPSGYVVSHWYEDWAIDPEVSELIIMVELSNGDEVQVYDVRINDGQSLREQLDGKQ